MTHDVVFNPVSGRPSVSMIAPKEMEAKIVNVAAVLR